MKALLLAAILSACTIGIASAIELAVPQDVLTVPLVAVPPVMDGTLSDRLWQKAAVANLGYDVNLHQPAKQSTTAYVLTDGKFLYVAFDVKTAAPISAQEHTNGVGMDTDDEVQVDLWPGGDQGFQYKFTSTPIGTHYQFSTENNSYEPTWTSAGKINAGGFTVTMKIPLGAMRGASKTWRVQFIRLSPATREALVWRGAGSQSDFNDVTYAGRLTGIPIGASSRPRSRIAVYGLGALATRSVGGSTSRGGADLSIPLDSSTTFVATLHPDYSNVEKDQQSISPTAFRRSFSEVRPFFSQGANFYNPFSCTGCPLQELYTPAIPTPRDGYAIEGKEGRFNFAGFDAVGIGRNDSAQSFYYKTPNRRLQIATQRVATGMPGFTDVTTTDGITYNNHSDLFAYYNWGVDRGTAVLDNGDNKRSDFGIGYEPPNFFAGLSIRKVGTYYNPVDGLVFHPGIAGYNFNFWHQWNYTGKSPLKWLQTYGSIDRYHGANGALNQTDNNLGFDLLTRNFVELWANTGSSYLLLGNGVFAPITINSRGLGWRSTTAYPTSIEYDSGRFGPGRIVSWARSSVVRVGNRASVTLQANDTQQHLDGGQTYTQWLERLSYSYQSGSNESFAVGVRRIVGTPPMLDQVPSFSSAWNLSFAYHKLLEHNEIYLVYGDASAFATSPQLIFKIVHYFGADKGT